MGDSMMTNGWRTQFTRLLAVYVAMLLLAACGGRSTVVTQDDSAEYRSAQSLPPLIKPNSGREDSSVIATNSASQGSGATSEPVINSRSPGAEETQQVSGQGQVTPFNPAVVERSNGEVVLALTASPEESWQTLRTLLNQSDITVHTRNQAAGRVAIGCAAIGLPNAVGEQDTVTRRGGWSIFNRSRKPEESEHCGLQMTSAKGVSAVSVLNRQGQVVSAELARALFARLMNPPR